MNYNFNRMSLRELSAAIEGPTGDRFARPISRALLNRAVEERALRIHDEVMRIGTFGWVLEGMQDDGNRYRRAGWNGKGMFIFLVPGTANLTVDAGRPLAEAGVPLGTEFNYLPHIDMWTAQGDVTAWTPSQADLLANDWEEV